MEDVRTDPGGAAEADQPQRVYLVIMDDTEEAGRALRFAARRAVDCASRFSRACAITCWYRSISTAGTK